MSHREKEEKSKAGVRIEKQVLTRIVEQTDDKRERVYRIDFCIPEFDTGWMWLATIGDRKKAKRIAQMCRDGRL